MLKQHCPPPPSLCWPETSALTAYQPGTNSKWFTLLKIHLNTQLYLMLFELAMFDNGFCKMAGVQQLILHDGNVKQNPLFIAFNSLEDDLLILWAAKQWTMRLLVFGLVQKSVCGEYTTASLHLAKCDKFVMHHHFLCPKTIHQCVCGGVPRQLGMWLQISLLGSSRAGFIFNDHVPLLWNIGACCRLCIWRPVLHLAKNFHLSSCLHFKPLFPIMLVHEESILFCILSKQKICKLVLIQK